MAAKLPDAAHIETRLLLVGKTGAGKSSTGNSLLGEKVFQTSRVSKSITKTTDCREATRMGRKLVVVDTPGFYDTSRSNTEIVKEIIKIFGFLNPGFHAILYVMDVGRFTEESVKTKDLFIKTFGDNGIKHTIIIITHYDCLKEEHVDKENYLASSEKEFLKFQKQCDNRVVMFNNKAGEIEMKEQLHELFAMIDNVVRMNQGKVYSNYHLKLVRKFMRIERKRKVVNINRARKDLFNQTAKQLNIKRVITYDPSRKKLVVNRVKYKGSSHTFTPKPVPQRTSKTSTKHIKIKVVPIVRIVAPVHKQNPHVVNTGLDDEKEVDVEPFQIEINDETIVEVPNTDENTTEETDTVHVYTELHTGSDEASPDIDEDDVEDDRTKMKNKSFFDSFADFFLELFRPLLD